MNACDRSIIQHQLPVIDREKITINSEFELNHANQSHVDLEKAKTDI